MCEGVWRRVYRHNQHLKIAQRCSLRSEAHFRGSITLQLSRAQSLAGGSQPSLRDRCRVLLVPFEYLASSVRTPSRARFRPIRSLTKVTLAASSIRYSSSSRSSSSSNCAILSSNFVSVSLITAASVERI